MPIEPVQGVGSEQFMEAIRWIASAVIALAAFVGIIVRWMMVRIDTTQKSLEKAVDSFAASIDVWRAHAAEEKETANALASSQREILTELRALHTLSSIRKDATK